MLGGRRTAEIETLRQIEANLATGVGLTGCFDSFGDGENV
jgi:hypothetical protein